MLFFPKIRTWEPGPVLGNLDLNKSLIGDLYSGTRTRTRNLTHTRLWTQTSGLRNIDFRRFENLAQYRLDGRKGAFFSVQGPVQGQREEVQGPCARATKNFLSPDLNPMTHGTWQNSQASMVSVKIRIKTFIAKKPQI